MSKIIVALATVGGAVIIMGIIAVMLAVPTMLLWDALMPDIFNLPEITFWQALGMNLLCGILFKSSSASPSK